MRRWQSLLLALCVLGAIVLLGAYLLRPQAPEAETGISNSAAVERGPDHDSPETAAAMSRFEGRDQSCAVTTERIILDGMTRIAAVTTVTSLTVECRETLCRLDVAFPSREDVTRLIADPPPGETSAWVSDVLLPMLHQADLRPTIVPYPRESIYPERTYYFSR